MGFPFVEKAFLFGHRARRHHANDFTRRGVNGKDAFPGAAAAHAEKTILRGKAVGVGQEPYAERVFKALRNFLRRELVRVIEGPVNLHYPSKLESILKLSENRVTAPCHCE